MKRAMLLALMMLFAAGLTVSADVTTGKDASNAKKIEITGGFDNSMVSRDTGLTSVLDGCQKPATWPSDLFWSPLITLNLGIDVGDKATALVQLQNRRLDAATGTAANVDFLGGDNVEMAVEQAYINVDNLMIPSLTFKYGMQNLKFALREGGDAFFMDTNFSEVLAMPVTEANIYRGAALPKDTSEFGGVKVDYGSLKGAVPTNYKVSFFWGVVNESLTGRADERLTGLTGWYKLPVGDKNFATAGVTKIQNEAAHADIQTINVGVDYFGAMPNLELYAEYYTQSGDLTRTVDQSASAYRAGAKYDIANPLKPYVDVSYWFLSGGGTATKNKNFLSYENVQSTMILEDNVFGLDVDSNYKVLKVEAGISYKLDIDKDGVGEPLTVKLLFGQFTLADDPATMTAGQVLKDSLGTEIDLVATLYLNSNISFSLGYAKLTGGDFFTSAGGYNAAAADMQMIVFDTKLKF